MQKEGDEDIIKNKYECIVHKLKIQNQSLKARLNNLMKILTELKDYAISIDRNINDIEGRMPFENNSYCANYNCLSNVFPEDQNIDYSKTLIRKMKDLINDIDNKAILDN